MFIAVYLSTKMVPASILKERETEIRDQLSQVYPNVKVVVVKAEDVQTRIELMSWPVISGQPFTTPGAS